jgi:hypothetical protein
MTGGRQLSVDGTSRVTGDGQARFHEGLGVKFPGATRPLRQLGYIFRRSVLARVFALDGGSHCIRDL